MIPAVLGNRCPIALQQVSRCESSYIAPATCTVPRVDRKVIEMYRDAMDQATRNDIAAATAAHHELGRDYDDAVAEGLVDRIGAEIDKRVDARLRPGSSGSRLPAAIGAGITGVVAMIASRANTDVVVGWILAVWIVLAAVGGGAALLHKYSRRER
jgi:hypothetical protein